MDYLFYNWRGWSDTKVLFTAESDHQSSVHSEAVTGNLFRGREGECFIQSLFFLSLSFPRLEVAPKIQLRELADRC